jgi:hypothetical protein
MDPLTRRLPRRDFLAGSTMAVAALALGCSRRGDATPAPAPLRGGKVLITAFSDDGRRLRTERVDKVVKTDAEWRR